MTIYMQKGAVNTCIFTLNESVTLPSPMFILELVSKASNKSKLMWLTDDMSTNPGRFNKYFVEEVPLADEDLEDQKIFLETGSYDFFVWETDVDVLSTASATGVIESGQLTVLGNPQEIKTFDGKNVKVTFKKQQ